jgi:thioredoxin reductase
MVEKSYNAIVVGSGPNGLVTAIALFHFGVFIMTSDHPLLFLVTASRVVWVLCGKTGD